MTISPRPVSPVRPFYAPALDGVRGLAFLVVFLSHIPGLWMFPGGFGVTVFFFLSGFLITTLLRMEHGAYGHINFRGFFARRFLRILPPYYLTLGLILIGSLLAGESLSPMGIAAQLSFGANYWVALYGSSGIPPGSEVYWSLAVEEHFYLLFPFVAAALLSRGGAVRAAGWLFAASVGVLGWRLVLAATLPGDAIGQLTYRTDTRIDSILFGAILALSMNPVIDPPNRLMRALASPGASGLAAVGIVATLLPRDPLFRETFRYTVQGLLLVPLYIGLLARPEGVIARALAHPLLRWLGALSYTLYLVHDAVLAAVWSLFAGAPLVVVGAVAFSVSILYAEMVRRTIERPLGRLRASWRAPAAVQEVKS